MSRASGDGDAGEPLEPLEPSEQLEPSEPLEPWEQTVRDLLAAAGPTEPVPEEVAVRLDARLAELVAERRTGVKDLGGRRSASPPPTSTDQPDQPDQPGRPGRPRRVGVLLGAAAAIVVGGVALTQVPGLTPGTESGSDTAVSAEERPGPQERDDADGGAEAEGGAEEGAEGGAGAETPGPSIAGGGTSDGAVPVSSRTLVQDLVALRDGSGGARPDLVPLRDGCVLPTPLEPGTSVYEVVWDGEPALALLQPATGDGQVAVVRSCATESRVRKVDLPVVLPQQ